MSAPATAPGFTLSPVVKELVMLGLGVVLVALGWRSAIFDGEGGAVVGAGLMLLGAGARGLIKA
jgi:hypothetical protein